MKLRITPPEGFTAEECMSHLKQVVRTRARSTVLHWHLGQLQLVGPVPDLVLLKFHLRRFGYKLI